MAEVVPTVLAATPADFKKRLDRVKTLSRRVHVDICDGRFADVATIGLAQVYAEDDISLDLHLMVENPDSVYETAMSLGPGLAIYHFESKGNLRELLEKTHQLGIRAGLAIMPETTVEQARELIKESDHVLIFTGHLGHNAGHFQADQLAKVPQIREIKPEIEISVDGGVTAEVANVAVNAGVDVLYSGAFIQDAKNPKAAFNSLRRQAEVGVER